MVGYDYASELLKPSKPEPKPSAPSGGHDYASEVLKNPYASEIAKSGGEDIGGRSVMLSFETMPIENRDSFNGTAPFKTLAKAAMVDDPQTKIKVIAGDLFPGDKEAPSRFGIVDGEVVYLGKDNKIYRATPPGFMGGAKEIAANMTGNALPIVGGTVGGVMGVPGGIPGVMFGSALGAAGGKGVQQSVANLVGGEPQSSTGNALGMSGEAAFAAGGSLIGGMLSKFLSRNVSRDASRLDPKKVADLDRKASDVGGTGVKVDLNVAQRTDVPSIKGRVEAIARRPDAAADDMNAALDLTRSQAAQAAGRFVENAGNATSVRGAGESGRVGANAILDKIAADRSLAAKPWYEKALSKPVDLSDDNLRAIMDTPAFKSAYERAVRIAANEGFDLSQSKNNMQMLHYVKLGIDDLIEKGGLKEGVGSTEKRAIVGVKNRLLNFMDTASPDYARARSIYGHYMPTLKASREGMVGELADLADTDLISASKRVFSPQNSPEDIAKLRSLFFRYDQGNNWNNLLKGYLQDTLENASKETPAGRGAAVSWRSALMGNPKQAANLRAAMTQKQWSGFTDMMDVFEAVSRTSGRGNSITMQMQEANKALQSEAGRGFWLKVMQPKMWVVNWLEEARVGKHVEKQVEILNDPKGIARLKELKQLSPDSRQFIAGFSSLFGISSKPETNDPVMNNRLSKELQSE